MFSSLFAVAIVFVVAIFHRILLYWRYIVYSFQSHVWSTSWLLSSWKRTSESHEPPPLRDSAGGWPASRRLRAQVHALLGVRKLWFSGFDGRRPESWRVQPWRREPEQVTSGLALIQLLWQRCARVGLEQRQRRACGHAENVRRECARGGVRPACWQ